MDVGPPRGAPRAPGGHEPIRGRVRGRLLARWRHRPRRRRRDDQAPRAPVRRGGRAAGPRPARDAVPAHAALDGTVAGAARRPGCRCGCPSAAVATGCAASTASTGAAPRETPSGARPGASKSGRAALLVKCIPPDHVDGMLSYLRDFTDLPLGVYPSLGYLTANGRHVDDDVRLRRVRAHMALRWREEGAQLIGGCCGVGSEQIGAARAARAGTRPGRRVATKGGSHAIARRRPIRAQNAAARAVGRRGRALAVPAALSLTSPSRREAPSFPRRARFLVWRHLFREQVSECTGAASTPAVAAGLQAIQLALNGAEHVRAIDVDDRRGHRRRSSTRFATAWPTA